MTRKIVIAAPNSQSGKTMITCGLLGALTRRGLKVKAFKCGPDYIDPMYHNNILGIESKNLDLFFTDEDITRNLFFQSLSEDDDIAVIEGVMGLYDGIGGVTQEASTYHLAKTLNAPIIMVVNAKGMGRSVLALLKGFLELDSERLIKGVILNCVSKSFYEILKDIIENELDLKVLGYCPYDKDMVVESRHLGLKLPNEIENMRDKAKIISCRIEEVIDIDAILNVSLDTNEPKDNYILSPNEITSTVNIAIARDEAFCFYYKDNIRMLEQLGARVIYFSPLHDEHLPENIDGMIIGGGYPELYLSQLSKNKHMLEDMLSFYKSGYPLLAECGGFMYLHDSIYDKDLVKYSMVGAIEGECTFKSKLVRFGYIIVEDTNKLFLKKNNTIKGHEFHYYDSTNNGEDCRAIKPYSKRSYSCGHVDENHFLSFAHLYYPSNPEFIVNFIKACAKTH